MHVCVCACTLIHAPLGQVLGAPYCIRGHAMGRERVLAAACFSRMGVVATRPERSLALVFRRPFGGFLPRSVPPGVQSAPWLRAWVEQKGWRRAQGTLNIDLAVSAPVTSGAVVSFSTRVPEAPRLFRPQAPKIFPAPFRVYFKLKLTCNQKGRSLRHKRPDVFFKYRILPKIASAFGERRSLCAWALSRCSVCTLETQSQNVCEK